MIRPTPQRIGPLGRRGAARPGRRSWSWLAALFVSAIPLAVFVALSGGRPLGRGAVAGLAGVPAGLAVYLLSTTDLSGRRGRPGPAAAAWAAITVLALAAAGFTWQLSQREPSLLVAAGAGLLTLALLPVALSSAELRPLGAAGRAGRRPAPRHLGVSARASRAAPPSLTRRLAGPLLLATLALACGVAAPLPGDRGRLLVLGGRPPVAESAPVPARAVPPPTPTTGLRYAFAVQAFYGMESRVVESTQRAGFGWIKQQVEWARLQPDPGGAPDLEALDRVVDTANRGGLRVLLSVTRSPDWARPGRKAGLPDDPAAFGRFMGLLAQRYRGQAQAYECWNEENLAAEVGGRVDPESYFDLLKACYQGVKGADPSAIVVSGAPSPTGTNDPAVAMDDVRYLRALYAINDGEVRNYFDALGAHPEAFGNSPDETLANHRPRPFTDHPSFFLERLREYRAVMEAAGDGAKQVFATEFGYDSSETAVPGYEYALLVSQQDQADYLVRAFARAATDFSPWLGMVAVWNLNFQVAVPPTDEKWGWGVLRPDWSPRPAYTALRSMPKPYAK